MPEQITTLFLSDFVGKTVGGHMIGARLFAFELLGRHVLKSSYKMPSPVGFDCSTVISRIRRFWMVCRQSGSSPVPP